MKLLSQKAFLNLISPNPGPDSNEIKFDPKLPANPDTLDYTLSMDVTTVGGVKHLKVWFSSTPKNYMNTENKPLQMQVPPADLVSKKNREIKLTLDSSLPWRFPSTRKSACLQMGTRSNNDEPTLGQPIDRYTLREVSADLKTLYMVAPHVDIKDGSDPISNFDGISIVVEVDVFDQNDLPYNAPLVLLIDPDIKNPGDETLKAVI